MIYIDFQGGAHGNYLEFVCNRFLARVPVDAPTPFSSTGSSHKKQYLADPMFVSGHYSTSPELYPGYDASGKIISIQISHDDLLPLSSISLLRAGDFNLDNNFLEIDTYNKFNNPSYRWVLDNIIQNFFQGQISESYNAVRDESWPDIKTIDDFNSLPDWIREECINTHQLDLLQLDEQHPDCPRYILREFFKIGFKYPEQSGFITQQQKMIYKSEPMIFPFGAFYHSDEFVAEIEKIGQALDYTVNDVGGLIELHQAFLDRQPYKNSKSQCDDIIERIITGKNFELDGLDLLKESYISAKLELYYNKEHNDKKGWFTTSQSMREYFQHVC